jgi:hypothetical protein
VQRVKWPAGLVGLAAMLALALVLPASAQGTHITAGRDGAGAPGEPVIAWNATLLAIVRTAGAQPATIHPTRSFAIMHAAIHDAVVSATGAGRPYLLTVRAARRASATAAAEVAAHDTLAALYPAQRATFDQQLAAELAALPASPSTQAGERVGQRAAAAILAIRAGDGSDATPPPFPGGDQPGDWRPTPPSFAPAVFTHWAGVTPFVLRSAAQFRPAPPPALDSDAYARAVNEVERLGRDTGSGRSADQTVVGTFWSAPIWNYWNEIAQSAATRHHTGLATTARLFAELNLTFADGVIAFYDAKYAYHLWRPITAIREADSDGNPATVADSAWNPLVATPADPSYPGAHSVISAAGASVLDRFFGDRDRFSVTTPTAPGVTRSFRSFQQAATEAGLSRIYAGVHTRLDHESGELLGRSVASFVLRHALSPVSAPA